MFKKSLIALTLALAAAGAQAAYWSGHLLNDLVEENSDSARMASYGFIAGVVDTNAGEWLCIPGAVTLGQMRDVVKAYMRDNPEMRHQSAAVLVTVALFKPWGCADKKNAAKKSGKMM